jgi:multiple antibiotic resistance protein
MWWQRHLSEFVTLFLVINPFGVLPAFLVLAAGRDSATQRRLALNAVLIAFVVLVFFLFAGEFVLEQIGVSTRAFQIAGGIVLFLVALEMIKGDRHEIPEGDADGKWALAIYPLAIPKIAGPGVMLAVILLSDDDRYNLTGRLATVGVLALVLLIQFVILLASGPITRLIGTAGAGVIGRIMGMLLAALAVSMVLGAVAEWLNLPAL